MKTVILDLLKKKNGHRFNKKNNRVLEFNLSFSVVRVAQF